MKNNNSDEQTIESIEEVQDGEDENLDTAQNMIDLEGSIKTFHAGIAMKRSEVKALKESVKDALQNDQVYMEQEEKIKEMEMQQEKTKEQIMSLSSIIQIKEDIKGLTAEINDLQKLLSKYLAQYYEITKQTTITMSNGETYEIKQLLSLVKQSSKYKP